MRVHLRLAWLGVLWLAACGGDSTGGGPPPPPPPNSWVQRTSVAGGGVSGASSFVIDGRIYVANGFRNGWTNLVYRYDPSQNAWEQFPSTPTDVRANGIGFSIGGFGYIGFGSNCLGGGLCTFTYFKDLWRLDPTTRLWTRMADFPAEARANAVVFVVGDKAYVTGGSSANQFDTWQYNTSNNTWTQKADFAGSCNARAVAFSIGTKGYVGLGRGLNGGCKDFWAYDAVGFSIGGTAFVV